MGSSTLRRVLKGAEHPPRRACIEPAGGALFAGWYFEYSPGEVAPPAPPFDGWAVAWHGVWAWPAEGWALASGPLTTDTTRRMQTPHDRFFRYVFADPEHAAGELRTMLPAVLTTRLEGRRR